MENKLSTFIEVKSINEGLEECKKLVLENIKTSNCPVHWDGTVREISPEEQFDNIVNWCKENIKSPVWSHQDSAKYTWHTSYGAKHRCESKLKCYVANNWMKLAMIYAGLEVANGYFINYETGRLDSTGIRLDEILTNTVNFVCRKSKKDPEKFIINITKPIKYCGGDYVED